MDELARDHLDDLMNFLTEETQMNPEEIMHEVCMLVDNYRDEMNLNAAQDEKESIIDMASEEVYEEPDDQEAILEDAFKTLSDRNVNRGFLLGKATETYYKKVGLNLDSFSLLSPADKVKHRKAITDLFNNMVIKEAQKPTKTTKVFESSGAIKRKQKSDDDDDEPLELDDKTEAEVVFYKEQIKNLKKKIRLIKAEIEQAERQNQIEQVSSVIVSRNLDRVEEFKDELAAAEKELKFYQVKL